jgi:hypothetical protein
MESQERGQMEAQIEEWRTIVIDEEEINYEVSSCGRISAL